ncbi:unnamed protein product [Arabidopsis lyrata]|nr:unnamed protein product [Arabidopsis lyrata]
MMDFTKEEPLSLSSLSTSFREKKQVQSLLSDNDRLYQRRLVGSSSGIAGSLSGVGWLIFWHRLSLVAALAGLASDIDQLLLAALAGLSPESKILSFLSRRAFSRRLWPGFLSGFLAGFRSSMKSEKQPAMNGEQQFFFFTRVIMLGDSELKVREVRDWIALMAPPGRALSVKVPGTGFK